MIYFILILLVASAVRFPGLDILPSGSDANMWARILSAGAGVISVGLVMLIVKERTKNIKLSLFSGLMLCFMPWHIEQSRVISGVNLGLTLILFYFWIYQILPCRYCKIFLVVTIAIIFWRIYPSFWLFTGNSTLPELPDFLGNLFKLVSGEFLFFKNDTFWWGGLRTYGVMLPSALLIFIAGLVRILQQASFKYWKWYAAFVIVWLISAASPYFPESREFFLISPFLAFICALGSCALIKNFNKRPTFRILFILYILFIIYEYLLLTHFYLIHYPQRIKNETSYEKINF